MTPYTLNIRNTILLSFLGISFSVVLVGCGYHRKNETYSFSATVTPHFSSINARIIQPRCMPCHATNEEEQDFSNYSGVFRRVKSGLPQSSSFYTAVESGSMPVGRPMLSDDELLAIYQWIKNGAPND